MPTISDTRLVPVAYQPSTLSLKYLILDAAGALVTAGAAGGSGLTDAELRATPVPVSGSGTFTTKELRSGTGAVTSVGDSAVNVTLLASNANRLGATFWNTSSAILYLKLGATATSASFTVAMAANSYFEVPYGYTGIIDGIWASDAGGVVVITELS